MSFVVTKAPYRISFFGGGTDYPDWYRAEGGQVISTAIDRYCYVTCRYFPEFFPPQHRIVWSVAEAVNSIADIRHPAVREALMMLDFDDSRGLDVNYHGELPARTGMASSSAFAAGLIQALTVLKGGQLSHQELYQSAIKLEQVRLGEHVGSQDQIAVSCGGMNHIRFGPGDAIEITPFEMDSDRKQTLKSHLMLFYLGRTRLASDIAGEVIANIGSRKSELREIGSHVDSAISILKGDGDLADFGKLLDETWQLKRQLGQSISNDTVDEIYSRARDHGAIGGKLLGAGGTGFMLLFVPPELQSDVAAAMAPYMQASFDFEEQGCQIVANEP
jgi:D-glycero-alpha-D-manno-heptose-7-phosphate kinase